MIGVLKSQKCTRIYNSVIVVVVIIIGAELRVNFIEERKKFDENIFVKTIAAM